MAHDVNDMIIITITMIPLLWVLIATIEITTLVSRNT